MSQMNPVFSSRGAPMGRGSVDASDRAAGRKFRLYQVRIDSGGYDDGGAYWGLGEPLYCAHSQETDDGREDEALLFFRAPNRDAARLIVAERYPAARFYR